MIKRRAYFTLIEIVLSIALVALIMGAVAFNIRFIVGQQKFLNEVAMVTDTLNRAQQLMMVYDKPMKVKFSALPNGIQLDVESDCLLSQPWEKWLVGRSKILTEIHSLNFQDMNYQESGKKEKVIYFLPNGGRLSKGVMELSSAKSSTVEGAYNAYICLPGYLQNLKSMDRPPERCDDNIAPYIVSSTKNEVIERAVNIE